MLSRVTLALIALFFTAVSKAEQLIDIESFAKFSTYQSVKISPTGKYLAVQMRDGNGINAIAVFNSTTLELTAALKFGERYFPYNPVWISEDRLLMNKAQKFWNQEKPLQTGELIAMNADGKKKEWLIRMPIFVREGNSNKVGNDLKGFGKLVDVLRDDPDHILISVYPWGLKENLKINTLYRINVYNGRVTKVARAPIPHADFVTDRAGKLQFSYSIDETKNNEFKVFQNIGTDEVEWKQISLTGGVEDPMLQEIIPLSYIDAEQALIARQRYLNATDALVKIDLKTGKKDVLLQHSIVDFGEVIFDEFTGKPILTKLSPDYQRVEIFDPEHDIGKWYPTIDISFKGQFVWVQNFADNGGLVVFSVSSDKNAGQFYLFNTNTKKIRSLFDASPWLESNKLAESIPIKFENRKEQTIHGYLTLPNDKESNLAAVVFPHGGPASRDYWEYNAEAQFLANRGYAVLQVNFTGSTGYGKGFEEAGYRHWGDLIMEDIIDGTQWMIDIGVANKSKVCIMGVSFGGYSALMAPTIEPDLYKCAVSIVGVSDLELMWEEGDINETVFGRNYLMDAIGKDENELKMFSPVNRAHLLKAPVLLMQGGEDERVPEIHYEAMIDTLKKQNHSYETFYRANEGHGFYNEKNRIEYLKAIEKFLAKYIGN